MRLTRVALLVGLAYGAAAGAQTITVAPLACLPNGDNGVVSAQIEPTPPADVQARLYFRRMNVEVEDFYYSELKPAGGGNYWGIFPQPENAKVTPKELKNPKSADTAVAEWWRAKDASDNRDPNSDLDQKLIQEKASVGKLEKRDWMAAQDDAALQAFLKKQTNEPAEYYIALIDASGRQVSRSPQQVVEVRDDCSTSLTPQQAGLAANMTVGETAPWQSGEAVFHWECSGVVSRIDPQNVIRADESCRGCVIAWWPRAAAAALAALAVIIDDDPSGRGPSGGPTINPNTGPEVSPSRP